MMPIHELLSRIRWDREFGSGNFEIGYYDRLENKIIRVPFSVLIFPGDRRDSVLIIEADGESRSLPLHRIKEVYRNRKLIWQRRH